jgi:hypothetical protein
MDRRGVRVDQLTPNRIGVKTAYDTTCGLEYSGELERAQTMLKSENTRHTQKSEARTRALKRQKWS